LQNGHFEQIKFSLTQFNMEITSTKPRRPWLAALLSLLFGPLGQVYAGRLRRSICLFIFALFLFIILAFCTISLPIGQYGFMLLLLCVLAYPVCLAIDAFLLAKRNRHALLKRYQRWWIYIIIYIFFILANNVVAHFVRFFIVEAFVIPTRSMSPTIQAGDRFLVDKLCYNRKDLHRGDVVVYRRGSPDSQLYVTRIAGLPGDEIEIKNERVFINGTDWDDKHAEYQGPLPPVAEMLNHIPIKVPPNCIFILGDNRRRSKDSRLIGPISMSDVYGKARIIYWSQDRIFPDPEDTKHYELGPIRWERMCIRLD
jgi:signal peptidase I